ncbi:hypothetical protein [Peptostreptococcus canis]|uniref:Uncharacterized protein n=1 Tax=Peptostreptococcus canis TaxID=1159213 RepID=A0ABR6TJZ5_9FIRM|nr:hypothetical protein [Peptostreptococcus canis]MBC2575720.1 hypothetical protein [Peptostreptococcus canis]MBP1998165.1 myo-inositol catabolism protein IolC [Peptostreptococcus canis]
MKYLANNIDELYSFVDIPKENIIQTLTFYYESQESQLNEKEKSEIKKVIDDHNKFF